MGSLGVIDLVKTIDLLPQLLESLGEGLLVEESEQGLVEAFVLALRGRLIRFAVIAYLLAGVLLLLTSWPDLLAALLALPYAAVCARFWNITDATSETANRGWRRFLLLNFVTGFLVTMLMIWWVLAAPA